MPIDENDLVSWFEDYDLPDDSISVRTHVVKQDDVSKFEDFMVREIPSCYLSSYDLDDQIRRTGLNAKALIENKMPDRGSVMAGDFGEILTLFYLSGDIDEMARKIKKWRFKQDRRKAAPHSDVIILYREFDDRSSTNDFVICAEAKLKSTSSTFSPIKSSLEGYEADRTGRLARTLTWLREKAIDHENAESLAFVKRFTDDLLNTEFKKRFRAVAIIDRNFLDAELIKSLDLPDQNDQFEVVVLGINDLKTVYQNSFQRAVVELDNE
jgi:hypothetical protein